MEDDMDSMNGSDVEELLTMLDRWRRIATNFAQDFHDEWNENLRYHLGIQWNDSRTKRLPKWRATPVVNVIFPAVEQAHALMTDQRPIASVYRRAKGNVDIQGILDAIMQQIWTDQEMEDEVAKFQKDRLLMGTGILKTEWLDKKKDIAKNEEVRGTIPIVNRRVDPRDFFIDPIAEEIHEARYLFERKRVPLADLLDMFPDQFDEIMSSDHQDLSGLVDRERRELIEFPDVTVWDCWFKDSTRLDQIHVDEDSGEEEVLESMRKYPTGRHVKFIGDVVLVDEKNPYKWMPYTKSVLSKVPDEFWGLSLVTPMKMTQDEINQLEAMLLDNIKSNVFPIFVATEGSVDLEEFVNAPNTIIELRGGIDSSINRLPGVPLPSEVFNMVGKKIDDAFRISGVNDVTFGNTVGSSRPGAVKQNFEASITRIREYTRLSNRSLSEVGNKIIDLIQEFIPTGFMVTIASPKTNSVDMFNPETQKELRDVFSRPDIQEKLETLDITLNQANDEFSQRMEELTGVGMSEEDAKKLVLDENIEEFKNNVKEGRYGYRIDIHPIQQQDKVTVMQILSDMFRATGGQIPDAEALIEVMDFPNKDKLLRRMKRNQELQAQQAQQQQATNATIAQGNVQQPQAQGA